ncbi:hypothetical protein HSBAA_62190 [Vreelandella sulfidaeris]|uniref:Urease accessory protein UreF n=1 Tax=Vreelandella sulfidaeris TaxID=115553 RepID=A0A455UHN4_9GAMM|nr:hypothetical protein HSBAA_62190 [Halomonas sulfidaeris]
MPPSTQSQAPITKWAAGIRIPTATIMTTRMSTTMHTELTALERQSDELALLGLMQLVSPALPIGAFAFSQGLESAFELDWVRDEASLAEWLSGVLEDGLTRCELPVLARLHEAFDQADSQSIAAWDEWLAATRNRRADR